MKINRILENRIFSVKTDLYDVFEKKIVNAFYLERKIMMMKFGKKEQYQSRIQLVVFLVSCLEYFLGEIFKMSIDKSLITLKSLGKEKKLNSIKANLEELEEINTNKIKISEILAEEMNFQNIGDIVLLCDLLKIGKNFKQIPPQEKRKAISKLRGKIPDPRKKHSPNIEKKMTKFIIENFAADFALPRDQEKIIRMVNTVNKMIYLRHKIVHKAHSLKIDNWESWAYTMATVQLAFFVNECYKIELKKMNTKMQKQKTKFKQTEIGKIPEDWEVKELNGVASYITEKINLDMINNANFISTENMLPEKRGIALSSSLPKVGKITQFKEGDILFSNIRTYFKKLWLAKFSGGCSNDVLVIRKKSIINDKYLYYYLSQDKFFEFTVLTSKGTKMPRGDKNSIMSYEVNIPSISEQKAIAKILSSLDAKIELNQKMNKTLKAIGQALFKHWFIDFEFPNEKGKPYKSNGGEMINSELGNIPKGWKLEKLETELDFIRGIEPGRSSYNKKEKGKKFIRVGNLTGKRDEELYVDIKTNSYCSKNDILVSFDGTVGVVKIGYEGIFSSGIRKPVWKDKSYGNFYIYLLMLSDSIQRQIKSFTGDETTIKHVGKNIDKLSFIIPFKDKGILDKFNQTTSPIFSMMLKNLSEIKDLSQIRDSLLPKLMSGKIRVK